MQELAAVPIDKSSIVDPAVLWLKAKLLRQWDEQRRVTRCMEFAERIQIAVGSLAALVLLGWFWLTLPAASRTAPLPAVLIASAMLAAATLVGTFVKRRRSLPTILVMAVLALQPVYARAQVTSARRLPAPTGRFAV